MMPRDMDRFRKVEEAFTRSCRDWGYQEIRTPTLEYLHLFTSAGTLTPEMLGRVYSFLDWDGWSGERVVLRPDGTIPAARLYVDNLEQLPAARLFYVENVFAFEGTGKESRERWQCGAELIGSNTPEGDVELAMLALECLSLMGIAPLEIRLSHAGIIRTLLGRLSLSAAGHAHALDKVFAGSAEVVDEIEGATPELRKTLQLLFNLQGDSAHVVENLKGMFAGTYPEIAPQLDNLAGVSRLLTDLGVAYHIDFSSGRGFEYYTGTIFGCYHQDRRLGGGGRYDELIPLVGGKKVSASGFALYIDDLMGSIEEPATRAKVLVRGKAFKRCLELAGALRDAGCIAALATGTEPESDFGWIVDAGEPDVTLTDRAGGKQRRLSPATLLKTLGETSADKAGST